MKILQTLILNIVFIGSLVLLSLSAHGQKPTIKSADSLFQAKQFTQSIAAYQALLNEKQYSPAMLLKMAYIEQGLGKIGATLYYLNLYHMATGDEPALQEAQTLAAKFNLNGYTRNTNPWQEWIIKNRMLILASLTCILLIASIVFFIQRMKNRKPWLVAGLIVLISASILYFNTLTDPTFVIVNSNNTFVMEGPSAGASVEGILSEGNRLELLGNQDVWLKVKWNNKIAFVKQNSVLKVSL